MIDIIHSSYILPPRSNNVLDWSQHHTDLAHGVLLQKNGCNIYHYAEHESLTGLGVSAIESLLSEVSMAAGKIDALILCQTSPCNTLPMPYTLIGEIRKEARLDNAWAFSIGQQQCVSPVHALRLIEKLFTKNPNWRHVLLVGVDTILQEKLRAIGDAGLHSDAASALLIGRAGTGSTVTAIETYNDPRAVIGIHDDGTYGENRNYLWSLITVMRRLAKAGGVSLESCRSILPHNVNLLAWQQALSALRLPRNLLHDANFGRIGHAFGSDAAVNIRDSGALSNEGKHLVFASGIGGCFGGFMLETGGKR